MKKLSILTLLLLATFFVKAQTLPDIVGHSIKPTYTYDGNESIINLDAYIRVNYASVSGYTPAVYISNTADKIGDFLGYLHMGAQAANTVARGTNGYEFKYDGDAAGKYIVIRVDGQNQVTESNENNNVYSKLIKKVDLRVSSVSGFYDGSDLYASVTVRANNADAPAHKVAVYVAATGGGFDDFVGFIDVPAQVANSSQKVTKSFPYSKSVTNKKLTAKVDAWNQVDEDNEGNNINWGSIYDATARVAATAATLPDVVGYSIKPTITFDGTESIIDLEAKIRVNYASVNGYHPAVYISNAPGKIGDFLGYLNMGPQAANTVATGTNGYPFKYRGNAAGKYIVIRVDGQNEVTESNESNNVYSEEIKKVDLKVTGASGFYDGTKLYVSGTYKAYNASVGSYYAKAYVAATGGGYDTFLGYILIPAQGANSSQTITKAFPYSGNVSGMKVTIKTDGQNQVDEDNESNNVNWGSIYDATAFRFAKAAVVTDNETVHPNPAVGTIKLSVKSETPVVIYDLNGKVVSSEKVKAGVYTKDVSNLKPGTYVIKTAKGSQTFIKQ